MAVAVAVESSVYCPPGFIDSEDDYGNVIEGGWRRDEERNTGMMSIHHTGSNRYAIIISVLCHYHISMHAWQVF